MKLDEYKNQFLNYLVEYRGRSPKTKDAYDFDLSKFINFLATLNIQEPQTISSKEIESYLFQLKSSTVTKARVRSSIKSFFNFLYKKGYVETNQAFALESMKLPEKTPEYLSPEQRTRFLKTIEQEATPYYRERDLIITKLLLKTGMRRAEIVGLDIGDVDLSKRTLRVKRKGNKEVNLYIHEELVSDLDKYLKTLLRDATEPLFMSKKGKRLSPSSVWHLIKSYSHKAGLNGNVTVHSLRHTFASTLLSKGMPLPYIQELMGHKSSQTTSRYLHFHNSELIEAFNSISFEERR